MPLALPDPPFADETQATVLQRMLDECDPAFNLDPGDIIYDMLAPAASEMDRLYDAMEIFMGEAFVDTASGTYLDALGAQLVGVSRLTGETDAAYRLRLQVRMVAPVGAGNVADYETWALEAGANVGYATALPLAGGPGTVTVLGATAARAALSGGEQTTLGNYIATKAPIGATVTIGTITPTSPAIAADIDTVVGYVNDASLKAKVFANIHAYYETLGPADDVLYFEVATAIMEAEGVANIVTLTIGGASVDFAVSTSEIAKVALTDITLT